MTRPGGTFDIRGRWYFQVQPLNDGDDVFPFNAGTMVALNDGTSAQGGLIVSFPALGANEPPATNWSDGVGDWKTTPRQNNDLIDFVCAGRDEDGGNVNLRFEGAGFVQQDTFSFEGAPREYDIDGTLIAEHPMVIFLGQRIGTGAPTNRLPA